MNAPIRRQVGTRRPSRRRYGVGLITLVALGAAWAVQAQTSSTAATVTA